MRETRKFRVLKDMMVSMSYPRIISSETILSLIDLGVVNGFNSFWCNEYKFIIRDLKTIISMGYLEEILPDKKPISSEENEFENPYGRQIYLAEAIHALTNHEVLIKDKYGYIWDYDKIDETFYTYDESGYTIVITDKYTVKELLEFQFDVIPKSIEEVKEKWVRINNHKDLATAISKGKEIQSFNTITKITTVKTKNFTDEIIDELFKQLTYNYFIIQYLEDN